VREAHEFVRPMEGGSTRPFLVRDESEELWVVKPHLESTEPKLLLNELVAGRLASHMKLPWPRGEILEISKECMAEAEKHGLKFASRVGVGLAFEAGLVEVPWPPGGLTLPDRLSFPDRNRVHIHSRFPAAENRRALYGMNVFSNWVLMKDTKYDTLFVGARGEAFFLDGSHAFAGPSWPAAGLKWDVIEIHLGHPYMEGVVTERGLHTPWLARVEQFDETEAPKIVGGVPEEWGIPQVRIEQTIAFLRRTREEFIPLFKQWLEWEGL
jgi:hypothetical protein